MKSAMIMLVLFVIIMGCEKEQTQQVYYLKATVIQTSDISCSRPLLDFSEDSSRIRSLTQSDVITFTVINLPTNYAVKNQKLYVNVTALQPSEEFPCNTLGLMYPRLKIVDAKPRD